MSKQEAVVPKKKRSLMELMKRREGQKALVIILFMSSGINMNRKL